MRISLLLLVILASGPGVAQAQGPQEDGKAKANVLLAFSKFCDWPAGSAGAKGAFTVGVLGGSPGVDPETLKGKEIGSGRSVQVTVFPDAPSAAKAPLVFISRSEEPNLQQVLAALDAEGVLTVSDIPGFARAGGVVEVFVDQGKGRFKVNLGQARKHKISVPAPVLELASEVIEGAR